jgi:hypothetical protein
LVLASRIFAFSASWVDTSFAFIIEYSAVRYARSRAPRRRHWRGQAAGNPSARLNIEATAIDWLLVIAKSIEVLNLLPGR